MALTCFYYTHYIHTQGTVHVPACFIRPERKWKRGGGEGGRWMRANDFEYPSGTRRI